MKKSRVVGIVVGFGISSLFFLPSSINCSSISHKTSYILPMNVEADFIKEALDAGLYKHTTRITSSILLQTSSFVHRTMAILHT